MANPTIKDVAKMAEVSIATVSLAIHDNKRISPETKQKVLDAVHKLNYHPSRSARGLVSRKTGNIGFILTNDHFLRTEPFYTHIFIGAEFEARENDLYVLLTTVDSDFNGSSKLPSFVLEKNIDGIIIAGKVSNALIEKLKGINLPVIFIDYVPRKGDFPVVQVDNFMGGMLATKHLIDLGHKKIAFIGGDIDHPSIKDRFNGYKNSLEKEGIPVTANLIEISENYPGQSNGYKAAEKLFSRKNDITAIFACNDAMAVGAIQYLKDKKRKVPEEISVIGFDDVIPENGFEPALSTVRVPKTELGSEAVKLISKIIRAENNGINKKFVPVELIIRKSTKSL